MPRPSHPSPADLRPRSPALGRLYDRYVGIDPGRVAEYSRAREDARREGETVAAMDRLVARWHDGDGRGTLHGWLGMTRGEYAAWAADPLDIPAGYVVPERNTNGEPTDE